LDIRTPGSLAFGLQDLGQCSPTLSGFWLRLKITQLISLADALAYTELCYQHLSISILQVACHGTSQLSLSCEPIPLINPLLYIYVHILLVLSVWRTLAKTSAQVFAQMPPKINLAFLSLLALFYFSQTLSHIYVYIYICVCVHRYICMCVCFIFLSLSNRILVS
jgi:hypothetical protein